MSDYDNLGRPTDHSPAAIRARYDAASRHVDDLCARRERWTMRVPVDPGRDSDMVIANALEDIPRLLDMVGQIVKYCLPIIGSNPPGLYDTALADHAGRQTVAEAVMDIIEGTIDRG